MSRLFLLTLLLVCESAFSGEVLQYSSGVYGGYTLASVSSSLQNLDNKKAEGYVVGAEFEALYKSEYLSGLKYQYTSTNYIESSEIYANLGAFYSILENRQLYFYFDFLLGVSFYRWITRGFTVNNEKSPSSSNSFSYGGDIGLRSRVFDLIDLKLSYQITALAKAVTYIELQPDNTDSSGNIVVNNKNSFLFSLAYTF